MISLDSLPHVSPLKQALKRSNGQNVYIGKTDILFFVNN